MKKIISFVVVILIFFTFVSCKSIKNETESIEKNITLQIIYNGQNEEINITTKAETLRETLEEKNLVAGEEGPYGLFVKTVKDVTVDETKQQWWCFTKGDEPILTGVDMIKISNGDLYKITLKEGY